MSSGAIRGRGVMAFVITLPMTACRIETAAPPNTVIVLVHRDACGPSSSCSCRPLREGVPKASAIDFEGNVGGSD